jgi:hypothetical protein
MNRSANGGDRSSLLHTGEGVLINPTSTKVCAAGTVPPLDSASPPEVTRSSSEPLPRAR